MKGSFIMELFMIIEMSEPLLQYPDFGKSNQLSLLCAAHLIHLPSRNIKSTPSPLVAGAQAFQPRPMLVGASSLGLRPSRTRVPLFSRAVFAVRIDRSSFTCSKWLEHGDVLESYSFFNAS